MVSSFKFDLRSRLLTLGRVEASFTLLSLNRSLQVSDSKLWIMNYELWIKIDVLPRINHSSCNVSYNRCFSPCCYQGRILLGRKMLATLCRSWNPVAYGFAIHFQHTLRSCVGSDGLLGTLEHFGALSATRACSQRLVPQEPEKGGFIAINGFIRTTQGTNFRRAFRAIWLLFFFFKKMPQLFWFNGQISLNLQTFLPNGIFN